MGIKAALAIDAHDDILATLTDLAAVYIARGETQAGADILAFVRRVSWASPTTRAHAQDHWDDLARYSCPRVLVDAEDFARKAYLQDIIDYVFADTAL